MMQRLIGAAMREAQPRYRKIELLCRQYACALDGLLAFIGVTVHSQRVRLDRTQVKKDTWSIAIALNRPINIVDK